MSPERTLQGRTVLTTRARDQAEELSRGLEALGARVVHIPTIEFVDPPDWSPVDRAIASIADYEWIVFTSATAVDAFMERAAALPSGVRVAAVGRQTARCLEDRRVRVDVVPGKFRAEGLLECFPDDLRGTKILFPRAEAADETLPETLRSRGATVDVVAVYRARASEAGAGELRTLLEDDTIDCITFTSGSTIDNLIAMFPAGDAARLLAGVTIAAIGPVTRAAVERWGLGVAIEPKSATMPDLVDAIARHFEGRRGPD